MPHDREPKFKAGDTVLCIHPALGLKLDVRYVIESCWGPNPKSFNYYLVGEHGVIPYKEERFRPCTPTT